MQVQERTDTLTTVQCPACSEQLELRMPESLEDIQCPNCSEKFSAAPTDLKRELAAKENSAAYCCEAAFALNVDDLPLEDPFAK